MNKLSYNFKKRVLYRSKYRGIKELDLLFEKFVDQFSTKLTDEDYLEINELLNIPDLELLDFILNKKQVPSNLDNKTFNRLRSLK